MSDCVDSEFSDLNKLLAGDPLPAMSQSAMRVLEVARDPNSGPEELASPIQADSALASQVLQFANSSYFGFRHEIYSVSQAVSLIGVRAIKNFVLWTAVFKAIPDPRSDRFSVQNYQADSLRRAYFAKSIAEQFLRADDLDKIYTAGLLQDIAIPVLVRQIGEQYEALLEAERSGVQRLFELETETFGWTHAYAARVLLSRWNLPHDLLMIVQMHTEIEQLDSMPQPPAEQIAVALSGVLPSVNDTQWMGCDEFVRYCQRLLKTDAQSLTPVLAHVDEQLAAMELEVAEEQSLVALFTRAHDAAEKEIVPLADS